MKIGFLSDAHGCWRTFELSLDILAKLGVEKIWFLGDSVGYVPSRKVVARLQELAIPALAGNHDWNILSSTNPSSSDDIYKLTLARNLLTETDHEFLKVLSPIQRVKIKGWDLLLVHGSPDDPLWGYIYPDSKLPVFLSDKPDFIFMGHTHRPFVREQGGCKFVNVGSCSLPRDAGGLGCMCILDTDNGIVEILRMDVRSKVKEDMKGLEVHSEVKALLDRPVPSDVVGRFVSKG